MVELDPREIARVAGDVGDDEAGGFGRVALVEHASRVLVIGWSVTGRQVVAAGHHRSVALDLSSRVMVPVMPTEKEILRINGHEVTVTNPRKVYFPASGHTKLDLVQYYLAVADGALRGAGGRPMALKRFVDGITGQAFFQKRAPENLPPFIRTATLTFPSGRTADEIVIDDAAGLAWVANLGCIDLNPHPVRAEDLDHPDELRVDLDPVPGRRVAADPARRACGARLARGRRAWSAGRRRRARAGSTSTSGSSRAGRSRRSAARRWPWPATWSAAFRTWPPQVVEGGAPRRLPRLQPERQGPDGGVGLLRPAAARTPASRRH